MQQKIVRFYDIAFSQKKQKELQAKALLNSINGYLINELGIILPEVESHLKGRIFSVSASSVVSRRLDPDYYKLSYQKIISQVEKSKYPLAELGDVTSLLASGKTPASQDYSEIPNISF